MVRQSSKGGHLPRAISKLLATPSPEALYLSIQMGDFLCEKSRTKQGLNEPKGALFSVRVSFVFVENELALPLRR